MPNTYKRKTNRQIWSSDQMEMAIEKVKSQQVGYLITSLMYCVPKSTLERRVKDLNKVFKGNEKGLGSKNKTFPQKLKKILWNTYKK